MKIFLRGLESNFCLLFIFEVVFVSISANLFDPFVPHTLCNIVQHFVHPVQKKGRGSSDGVQIGCGAVYRWRHVRCVVCEPCSAPFTLSRSVLASFWHHSTGIWNVGKDSDLIHCNHWILRTFLLYIPGLKSQRLSTVLEFSCFSELLSSQRCFKVDQPWFSLNQRWLKMGRKIDKTAIKVFGNI